jgi:hypothetical protein
MDLTDDEIVAETKRHLTYGSRVTVQGLQGVNDRFAQARQRQVQVAPGVIDRAFRGGAAIASIARQIAASNGRGRGSW